jgi:catechol 2,3-dioxygenase-like lactoylglutathione lyase family enzyme
MPENPFTAIDHVQLAIPPGSEEEARRFYVGVLGMKELQKPPELAARGGAWFASGCVQLHLGIEADFRPARKAHPALRCRDYHRILARLRDHGIEVTEDTAMPGVERCYVHDCFGNRIELIAD